MKVGDKVKDSATGFIGTVTSRAEHLGGEAYCNVENLDNDGRPNSLWVPESRLTTQ